MITPKNLLNMIATEAFESSVPEVQEFRPCAFYDAPLDCVRVFTKDCSVLEESIGDGLTIYDNLYPETGRKECVGFAIEGARWLFRGFDTSAPIEVSKLLDAILAGPPEKAIRVFIDYVAKPLLAEHDINPVDLSAR